MSVVWNKKTVEIPTVVEIRCLFINYMTHYYIQAKRGKFAENVGHTAMKIMRKAHEAPATPFLALLAKHAVRAAWFSASTNYKPTCRPTVNRSLDTAT